MSRQDPGYSGTSTGQPPLSAPSPRRTSLSTSSTRHSSPSTSKRWAHTSTYSASRPSTKRTTQSSPQTAQIRQSSSGRRPSLQTRHTTPCHYSHPPTTYQFFQLPSLVDNEQPEQNSDIIASPPPPATVQYWTSDSTRRLEYVAIDAASRGIRGFLVKIVPDCILPKTSRSKERSQFWKSNEGNGAGSVRRYRLALSEEKDCSRASVEEDRKRPANGILRRWTCSFRRSS
ncbi:hypothetical protein BGZ60DRAFT_391379 [Tricladium varicosporioides]|nr:hypothetical protein BGZ60DRAFT_391379 [Hymenoscyphus varicosporioides]